MLQWLTVFTVLCCVFNFSILGCAHHTQTSNESPKNTAKASSQRPGKRFFRVGTAGAHEQNPAIVPSVEKSAIVVCEVKNPENPDDIDLYAQRFSREGDPLWDKSRRVATATAREARPRLLPDGEGGAFVVFDATYNEGKHAGDRDIAAQRITAEGRLLWENGETSVIVAGSHALERNPAMVADGEGGLVVVFERKFLVGLQQGEADVMAQRVSADGKKLWGGGRTSVPVSNTTHLERAPAVVTDGSGGFIVVNELEPAKGKHAGDVDLVAQRLNRRGERTWHEGSQAVLVADTPLSERNPVAVTDGAGGMIVVFEAKKRLEKDQGHLNIAAQRIAPNGQRQWTDGRAFATVSAAKPLQERLPVVLSDGDGGVFVFFQSICPDTSRKGDIDLYAQRLSDEGVRMWNAAKHATRIAGSNAVEKSPCAVRLDDGSVLLAYEGLAAASKKEKSKPGGNIVLQRVFASGRLAWPKGLLLDGQRWGTDTLQNPALAADGRGNGTVVFEMVVKSGVHAGDTDIAGHFMPVQKIGSH